MSLRINPKFISPDIATDAELAAAIAAIQKGEMESHLNASKPAANTKTNTIIYVSDLNELQFSNGSTWTTISAPSGLSLTVEQINGTAVSVPNVNTLKFNNDTGFIVTDLGNGEVEVNLGSTFKTWNVDGQDSLIAEGEDTLEIIAGSGISLETDNTSGSKSLTINSTVSSPSNVMNLIENPDFKVDLQGWELATFDHTSYSGLPTLGASDLELLLDSSTPLFGSNSMILKTKSTSSVWPAGQGVIYNIGTPPKGLTYKQIMAGFTWQLPDMGQYSNVNFTGYPNGTFRVLIYSTVYNLWIEINNYSSSTGVTWLGYFEQPNSDYPNNFYGGFTPSPDDNLILGIFAVNSSSGQVTLKFDNFFLGDIPSRITHASTVRNTGDTMYGKLTVPTVEADYYTASSNLQIATTDTIAYGGNTQPINIFTGEAGISSPGDSGLIAIQSGNAPQGTSGQILIKTPNAASSQEISGSINLTTGNTDNATGSITLDTGDTTKYESYSGSIQITTGGGTNGGGTGGINIRSGTSVGIDPVSEMSSYTGTINLETGNGSSSTGSINLATGDTSGAGVVTGTVQIFTGSAFETNANSGHIFLNVGSSHGQAGNVQIEAGDSSNSQGGTVSIRSGDSGSTNDAGSVSILTGDSSTNNGGPFIVTTGTSSSGTSGIIDIKTGDSTTTANTGAIAIATGAGTGTFTGEIEIFTGGNTSATGSSGTINVFTGHTDAQTGGLNLLTGNGQTTGNISISTGDGTTSGGINLTTGVGTTSGDINLTTGVGASNRGDIALSAENITIYTDSSNSQIDKFDNHGLTIGKSGYNSNPRALILNGNSTYDVRIRAVDTMTQNVYIDMPSNLPFLNSSMNNTHSGLQFTPDRFTGIEINYSIGMQYGTTTKILPNGQTITTQGTEALNAFSAGANTVAGMVQRMPRCTYNTTSTPGTQTGFRATGKGVAIGAGFKITGKFSISSASTSLARHFFGLYNTAGSAFPINGTTNNNPFINSITNFVGFGADTVAGDTNFCIYYNSGTAGETQRIDLGGNFISQPGADIYEFSLYNPIGSYVIYYEAVACFNKRKVTGAISLTNYLPTSSQLYFHHVRSNAGVNEVARFEGGSVGIWAFG